MQWFPLGMFMFFPSYKGLGCRFWMVLIPDAQPRQIDFQHIPIRNLCLNVNPILWGEPNDSAVKAMPMLLWVKASPRPGYHYAEFCALFLDVSCWLALFLDVSCSLSLTSVSDHQAGPSAKPPEIPQFGGTAVRYENRRPRHPSRPRCPRNLARSFVTSATTAGSKLWD